MCRSGQRLSSLEQGGRDSDEGKDDADGAVRTYGYRGTRRWCWSGRRSSASSIEFFCERLERREVAGRVVNRVDREHHTCTTVALGCGLLAVEPCGCRVVDGDGPGREVGRGVGVNKLEARAEGLRSSRVESIERSARRSEGALDDAVVFLLELEHNLVTGVGDDMIRAEREVRVRSTNDDGVNRACTVRNRSSGRAVLEGRVRGRPNGCWVQRDRHGYDRASDDGGQSNLRAVGSSHGRGTSIVPSGCRCRRSGGETSTNRERSLLEVGEGVRRGGVSWAVYGENHSGTTVASRSVSSLRTVEPGWAQGRDVNGECWTRVHRGVRLNKVELRAQTAVRRSAWVGEGGLDNGVVLRVEVENDLVADRG